MVSENKDLEFNITQNDISEVVRQDPLVLLKLHNQALKRTCHELQDRIDELEKELELSKNEVSIVTEGD